MGITPVILCGGVGTRLWPVSNARLPKQFHSFLGDGTLLQETARRALALGLGPPVVVGSEADSSLVVAQLAAIGIEPRLVIAEPEGRNTAAAIAAAAHVLDGLILVMPADHVISDVAALTAALEAGVEAVRADKLVVFGIVPTRPETGYGYIRAGSSDRVWRPLVEFIEKPDIDKAERLVEEGCFWNSGMFLFDANLVLNEFAEWAPDVAEVVSASLPEPLAAVIHPTDKFREAPSVAFDRAVMEKTTRGAVVPLQAGWSDIGSWNALWEISPKDDSGNATSGDVRLVDVSGSYVRAERRVVVLGLSDVVVVESGGTVLVTSRSASQRVGELAEG
ncbi:MAG: sugar phosphate nucleotidyltransferase [Acidimicrobiia bacterium]|nr:sugar phosphate nucleotidyltransferase [Acidimicrobiia bacterium]